MNNYCIKAPQSHKKLTNLPTKFCKFSPWISSFFVDLSSRSSISFETYLQVKLQVQVVQVPPHWELSKHSSPQ